MQMRVHCYKGFSQLFTTFYRKKPLKLDTNKHIPGLGLYTCISHVGFEHPLW